MADKVSIPEAKANELVQTLADLLEDALHQVWHATQDPDSFNRQTAWEAYREIKAKAHKAVGDAFGDPPDTPS